jgi:glycosidase
MALAVSYLFLKGTPFVYQGQEIGMVNTHFPSIDEVPDVSAKNQYRNRIASGDSPEKAMALINRAARDHARTPVQWSAEPHAGFCPADVDPWFAENPNYPEINVARDEGDPDSVLNFYRKAIALRRELPVVRDGSYREFKRASDVHYFYVREDEDEKLLVMCSFADKQTLFRMPLGFELEKGELLLANYADAPGARPDGFYAFRPYECRVYRF